MDILLNKIIILLAENHLVTIPLLAVFSTALAFLVWSQLKQGWRFYFSKRRLIEKLRKKNL